MSRFLILKDGGGMAQRHPETTAAIGIKSDPPREATPPAEPKPDQAVCQITDMRMGTADQIEAAQRFAKAAQPMRLIDPERLHVSHLVGPDLAHPEVWRHTELVDGEPFSDAEFTVVEDAFLSALRAGGLPTG